MIFEIKTFGVDSIENKDIDKIIEVYNSNKKFLMSHMDKEKVTSKWVIEELKSMREVNFYCCKIVEISSGEIVGLIDFKMEEETYLSLLMIHNAYRNKGVGKLVYYALEEYALSLKSKCIRIDVVNNYDSSVVDFWSKKGFVEFKQSKLNWAGKVLPAVTMKKNL